MSKEDDGFETETEELSEDEETGERVVLQRKRNFHGYYPADVIHQVWIRGVSADSSSPSSADSSSASTVAHCYLCNRPLRFDKRQCDCPEGVKECRGCGAWQIEHIFAKSRDVCNNDVLENLLPACHRCNCSAFKVCGAISDLCAEEKGRRGRRRRREREKEEWKNQKGEKRKRKRE